MHNIAPVIALGCILATTCTLGCGKAKNAPAASPATPSVAPPPKVAPTPMPKNIKTVEGNVTSTPSEHVATGQPEPPRVAENGKPANLYHGKPEMELDSKTLADVRSTIEQTCQLLEEGVDVLEKHAKRPEKAAKALEAYQKKNAARIEAVFRSAADVRARLRSVGYDQDIPQQVRPEFEKRMGAIQERLEKMRGIYRKHRDVLEAFGKLFPRAR